MAEDAYSLAGVSVLAAQEVCGLDTFAKIVSFGHLYTI